MKGVKEVIDVLNQALAGELLAISQYIMHARMNESWGYTALADQIRKESMDEMEHAEELIDRILFLEGAPALQMMGTPNIGQTVTQQLHNDLALELQAVQSLNNGIEVARSKGDHTSAALLGKILADEEKHVNRIETQLAQIQKLGENAFLLTQIRPKAGG
jgi:bacterioferritin